MKLETAPELSLDELLTLTCKSHTLPFEKVDEILTAAGYIPDATTDAVSLDNDEEQYIPYRFGTSCVLLAPSGHIIFQQNKQAEVAS